MAAKTHQFAEDEDFQENMKLTMIDFSGHNVLEKVFLLCFFVHLCFFFCAVDVLLSKGFFGDLEKHFEQIAKFPYEVSGVSFRSCRLDDKAVEALRPAICKLKMLARADFSKNLIKEDGFDFFFLFVLLLCLLRN